MKGDREKEENEGRLSDFSDFTEIPGFENVLPLKKTE